MAVRVSYTKYNNSPAASFWSFMQTMGPIMIGLTALFGALGISVSFELKPVWSVLTFIGCFVLAIVGIIYFLKLTFIMINRALNKTWNRTIQNTYDGVIAKFPPQQTELIKQTEHAYVCFQCSTVSGYQYNYKGKCSKCKKPLFFTGASISGWNAMSEEERKKILTMMSFYKE